ncbi:hypothetical protein HZH66_013803 [Vespula vulgaris]|uniref:Uncharacterized protein n=1 Tax=Vespula vulgaris TaxID=7454 RepID=A0A834MRW7_VESVU|nr:hypothetical protein HZH66_013803 [Vespula vulgaris]
MSVKIRKTLEDDVYRASGQSGAASSRQGPTVLGDRGGNDPQGQTRSAEKEGVVVFISSFLPESRLAFSVEFKGRASQYFGKFFKWTIRESKIGNGVGAAVKGRTRLDIRQIKPTSLERPATAAYPEN